MHLIILYSRLILFLYYLIFHHKNIKNSEIFKVIHGLLFNYFLFHDFYNVTSSHLKWFKSKLKFQWFYVHIKIQCHGTTNILLSKIKVIKCR